MNNTESGTPPEKGGTWQNQDGSQIPKGRTWYVSLAKKKQGETSNRGQSTPTSMKSENSTPKGHDAGDEDPKAWQET